MRKFLVLVALFTALSGAAEARPVTVRLADLDLTTIQDVEVAYSRLQRAARLTCKAATIYPMLRRQRACERDTLDRVVEQVGAPMLIARHAGPMDQLAAS